MDVQAALDIPPDLVVVDDDAIYRADVVARLREAGFPCQGVGSAAELAVALAEQSAQIGPGDVGRTSIPARMMQTAVDVPHAGGAQLPEQAVWS